MDDMFGMLYGSLSPEKKLRTAVTNNLVDSVIKLIEEFGPSLINAPLYTENQRTAMHLACEMGHLHLVEILVEAGGDVNAKDLFGLTPLLSAMRHQHQTCVRRILYNCSWHPSNIWQETRLAEEQNAVESRRRPAWMGYSVEILCVMVIGTPNLLASASDSHFQFNDFVELCERYHQLAKAFYLTGNQLPAGHVLQLYQNSSNLAQWIKAMLAVQSLQHYARIAIRRSLETNVFYGAKHLPLPVPLQDYLQFSEEFPL